MLSYGTVLYGRVLVVLIYYHLSFVIDIVTKLRVCVYIMGAPCILSKEGEERSLRAQCFFLEIAVGLISS